MFGLKFNRNIIYATCGSIVPLSKTANHCTGLVWLRNIFIPIMSHSNFLITRKSKQSHSYPNTIFLPNLYFNSCIFVFRYKSNQLFICFLLVKSRLLIVYSRKDSRKHYSQGNNIPGKHNFIRGNTRNIGVTRVF